MKTFLAVYLGTPEAMGNWNALPEGEQKKRQQQGLVAWQTWVEQHKAVIIDVGGPLGKTKQISAAGVIDTRNAMTGYTVFKAESHEAAARMFEGHPHFTIFPGEAVEVMECLPIPG